MAAWIALIATVALDLLLIPRWGIIGAAVASSVAYSISDCAMVASYRRLTGVGLRSLYITTLAELAEVAGRLGNLIRRTPQQ
jgi:O-antigen/teichoic acid export membrane protein